MQNDQSKSNTHRFQDSGVQQRILRQGSRNDIIEWLIWNDGNGIYSDGDSDSEGYASLTLEAAKTVMKLNLEKR